MESGSSIRGIDHFIEYLDFIATSLDGIDNASKYVEYFMWWIQATPPHYHHVTLVEIVEISSSLSSSSDTPEYVPQPSHDKEEVLEYMP